MAELNSKDQSEFNAAISHLMQIDKIKQLLVRSTLTHNYADKYNSLTAYYSMLISIMKDEDDKAEKKSWLKITNKYYDYLDAKKKGQKIPSGLWFEMMDWEFKLRNIEQKYGLCLPKGKDYRYAMANKK